jgi:hypothetical protein
MERLCRSSQMVPVSLSAVTSRSSSAFENPYKSATQRNRVSCEVSAERQNYSRERNPVSGTKSKKPGFWCWGSRKTENSYSKKPDLWPQAKNPVTPAAKT